MRRRLLKALFSLATVVAYGGERVKGAVSVTSAIGGVNWFKKDLTSHMSKYHPVTLHNINSMDTNTYYTLQVEIISGRQHAIY